jgi:glucose/arabinose dehydrogenase
MKMRALQTFYFTACLFLMYDSTAQKGLPAKKISNISNNINYAQHVDFKPSMVNGLKVAAGWKVIVSASGLGKPRMLYMGENGTLYITRRDQGDVLMLKDNDNDNKFDDLVTIVAEFPAVHGITIKNGWLYLVSTRVLRRYKLNEDGTVGMMQELCNDLPDGGQHPNHTIEFGPDGMLYLTAGSTCNDCFESNKEAATILQIDTTTWKRTVFARGLRNTIGFDFHPATKQLWGLDNGGDAKGDNWPPEELNMIVKDGDYGWPLAYSRQVPDETREDPPGTTKAMYAKTTMPSVLDFTAHTAPIAFRFFGNANVPQEYKNDGLVCWHGSWNRAEPAGFKVQRIKFENGKAVGAEDFLSGFLSTDKRTRFGRPAGLFISPKGQVFISDDANGILYCVVKN